MLEGSGKTCQQQRQGGQNKGGEPPKENVQDGADWLHQRRDRSRTDHSALRRIPMHGRRCKHRPSSQHGDLVDLGRRGAKNPVPGARSPAPGARCPAPGARSPVPGARCLKPGARSSGPGAQSPVPDARRGLRRRRQWRRMGLTSSDCWTRTARVPCGPVTGWSNRNPGPEPGRWIKGQFSLWKKTQCW
jgi:hypothetical protein